MSKNPFARSPDPKNIFRDINLLFFSLWQLVSDHCDNKVVFLVHTSIKERSQERS